MLFRYAYPAFTNRFEVLVKRKSHALLLFVDEAYWMLPPSPSNALFGVFRKIFSKYPSLFTLLDGAVATNPNSAEIISRYCSHVEFIPHVIDTDAYLPVANKPENQIWIGWSGSFSTYPFIEPMVPFLLSLPKRYPQVHLLFFGTERFRNLENVISEPWTPEKDIPYHQKMDIGLAPYPDNAQTQTKCPVKLLVYMALGIPVIASPVGMVPQMILHGETGFLAKNQSEWERYLIQLIEDAEMRKEMGRKAREHVEKHFSVKRWAPVYAQFIRSYLKSNTHL
jgi:glycosyltransferase involved in cell wall biosynthesis